MLKDYPNAFYTLRILREDITNFFNYLRLGYLRLPSLIRVKILVALEVVVKSIDV